MGKIIIDTEHEWDDVEIQIMEMETHDLLAIYDMFVSNPTVFGMVANELLYRNEHERKIESQEQLNEITERISHGR